MAVGGIAEDSTINEQNCNRYIEEHMEDKPNDSGCGSSPIGYVDPKAYDAAKVPLFAEERLRTKDRNDREKFYGAQTEGSWDSPATQAANVVSSEHRLTRAVEKLRACGERDKFQGQTLLHQAECLRAFLDSLPRQLSYTAAEGLNVLLNRAGL